LEGNSDGLENLAKGGALRALVIEKRAVCVEQQPTVTLHLPFIKTTPLLVKTEVVLARVAAASFHGTS
jgi:hypothetical protein